jgi:hypothetical protein
MAKDGIELLLVLPNGDEPRNHQNTGQSLRQVVTLDSYIPLLTAIVVLTILGAVLGPLWKSVRARGFDRWVPAYVCPGENMSGVVLDREPIDVFLAICDHYEPEWGNCGPDEALDRVKQWCADYPRLFEDFRDVDGRPPRHSFFFPQDQYRPEYIDPLAELCHDGFGEFDIHLHHDDDTPEYLEEKLSVFRDVLFHRHGMLRRDPTTGQIVYGFIHGNWALNNSRRDRRWCGVDHEIPILLRTGCYADFTMPSAPSDTQTRTINSIYYAADCPGRCKSHDTGIRARVGQVPPPDNLLMIQGPLGFDFSRRKFGILPRVENGDLLGNHPPSLNRLHLWLQAGVTVHGRPNWRFVKLHTHGCKTSNMQMLLGQRMQMFHQELAELRSLQPNFRYHYVSAWEMSQLVHRAERNEGLPSFTPDSLQVAGVS